MDRASEDIAAIEVGLERVDGSLRAGHAQERCGDGRLNIEPGQRLAGTCARDPRLCGGDRSLAQAEIKRFPGEQRPHGAAPHAAARRLRQHRPGHGGDHGLRQDLAEDVVGGRPIRLPQGIQARQGCRLRDADTRRGDVHLLERRADRRVVIQRVLHRLVEREGLR